MSIDPVRYLTPPQIADHLGCKPETVISWIKNGELKAINLARLGSMKSRYRVSPEALAAFELARSVIPKEPTVRRRAQQDPNIKKFV